MFAHEPLYDTLSRKYAAQPGSYLSFPLTLPQFAKAARGIHEATAAIETSIFKRLPKSCRVLPYNMLHNIQKAAISKEKWWPSALLWDPAATYLYSLST